VPNVCTAYLSTAPPLSFGEISGQFSLALSIRSDSVKSRLWTWATFPRTGNMLCWVSQLSWRGRNWLYGESAAAKLNSTTP